MKRMTAWLLAFSLILSGALPARAAEIKTGEPEKELQTEAAEGTGTGQDDESLSTQRARMAAQADIPEGNTGVSPGADSSAGPGTSPTVSPVVSPSAGSAASPTASPGTSPTVSPGVSPSASPSVNPTASPSVSPSASPGVSPSVSPAASPSVSPSVSPTASPGVSPSASPAASPAAALFSEDDEAWNEVNADDNVPGGIEVIIRNVLPTEGLQLSVVLKKGEAAVGDAVAVPLDKKADKHTISFDNLASGTYSLEITGPGFIKYKQDISVSGNIQTAEIHTGFVNLDGFVPQGEKKFSYEKDNPHPGVMLIGDANGDGVLDDNDRDAIMNAMSRGVNGVLTGEPDQNPTDLDRDGKTDLVDLQYYVNSRARIDSGADTTASLCSVIAPGAAKVNLSPDTSLAEGSKAVEDLLKETTGVVSFQNTRGEEISENAPVFFGFNLQSEAQEEQEECVSLDHVVISMGDAAIENGVLTYETKDGEKIPVVIENGKQALSGKARSVSVEGTGQDGQLVINLGGQVAIKKVTIKITAMADKGNLAQISRVEFLNGMENRIPEPEMNIPKNLSAEPGDKSFSLTWSREVNVTGYEVKITKEGTEEEEVVRAASNSLEVKSLNGNKLENGVTYKACVQSVNGNWESGYSTAVSVTPEVSKVPDRPDNLKAVGGYCVVRMSWKNVKEADTYNVYYKEAGAAAFTKIEGVTQSSYEITGLKELTRYEVYVTGVNILGEGSASLHSEAQTTTLIPAKMPNYKLINESNGKGKVSAHIVDAAHVRGAMVSSPLDSGKKSALGTVDKDFASAYQVLDWDDGAAYVASTKGLLFTLDDYYKMSYITFAETEDIAAYGQVSVYYYDEEHPEGTYSQNPVVLQRTDENGRKYYLIKLAEPITANKVRLGFARNYALRNIVIAEVNFYYYDSLEDDILGLYENDLQTSLREDVTEDTINELQKRLDTVDSKSGEYHPERDVLQRELDNAKGLLENGFNDVIEIKSQITAKNDGHLGFSGLNAWQPLGITAYEGEQIVIYVGHNQLKTGENSALKLIATQYHAESGALATEVAALKVGRNEITIPSIQSLACEGGGALYVQYTGNNADDRYAVRVNGGVKEPVLDLYGVTDTARRRELVTAYVKELEEHVPAQEALHKEKHETAGENNKVNRPYEKENCILGATEIVLDQMMLSVSAEQILSGLGNGTTEDKAAKLDESLRAMDEMLDLFYHHKGLSTDPLAPATDRMPAQHLNIRYMRMFSGAFMYAAGNHVGIEWGSVPGLAGAVPVQSENGKYLSGNYFGWGIAHEIGHNINQGSYAIAEVTNNYFSVLAQAKDTNDSVRFQYGNVYQKVTSNTVGKPSNVFTHLAMYWQLHLAYDRGYNYKIYESYQEQHDNLFYARVDSYSRNTALAPGSLKLNGGSDQNIMRLACAAAERDLTEFFMRWGLVPDQETISYASQFPKEERAVYYLNDEARVYEIENGTAGSIKGESVISPESTVQVSEKVANEVNITIRSTADPNVILGYEIARYSYENGDPVRQVVGFTTENTYQDYVTTVNNRVMTYEVIAVDKFGYRSNAAVVGDVRISHNGVHDKSMWTVTTNLYSENDSVGEAEEEDPCAPEKVSAIYQIIDNNYKNTYEGITQSGEATVLISLNQVLPVCGLEYTVDSGDAIGNYRIEVSVDGSTWTEVKAGSFDGSKKKQTVYFENEKKDPWVCTYDAAYVRLKATGQNRMNISEIDLLGPSGDDISFGAKEESTAGAVGILQKDYVYEKTESGGEKVIPKGSLIFTGSYKGNPAYNVVVLYDENGAVVGGVDEQGALNAEQIILANVPENGELGEVSRGTWLYWIKPSEEGEIPDIKGKVRAQLFRVDNAMTNEGQRLVSDTLPLVMPAQLEGITLENNTGESE